MKSQPEIAFFYAESAYQEPTIKTGMPQAASGPKGIMGRQVAGTEFLNAYFEHGKWEVLNAIVGNSTEANYLSDYCHQHPSSRSKKRRLRLHEKGGFSDVFCRPNPPASLVYFPCPPAACYAWSRQYLSPHAFAISGVTHTLCSAPAIGLLRDLAISPYQNYDALVCTSQCVRSMVQTVIGTYADYLGISNPPEIQLPIIPLGVDTQKFRPATQEQKLESRQRLRIETDEFAVLFVGRLAYHAKAHPFPMFLSLSRAAQQTNTKIHLVMAGWSNSPQTVTEIRNCAQKVAPNIRISIVDGSDPDLRFRVWQAADLFTSLSDNIQETFGLVVLEAMASGLPVVATDWNGYRDLIEHRETGWLVPTSMVRDATVNSTLRLLTGEVNYDHFLAECNQAVAVDCEALTRAYIELISNSSLRAKFGEAGRNAVESRFDWKAIVDQYQQLWLEQDRRRVAAQRQARQLSTRTLAFYPQPEVSFDCYPTDWLGEEQRVCIGPDARKRLDLVLDLAICTYGETSRLTSKAALEQILQACTEPRRLSELDKLFVPEHARQRVRATVAWMLKYDILRPAGTQEPKPSVAATKTASKMCFVTTCMGRLDYLRKSLPHLVRQPGCSCIVVDFSCPQHAGDWVEREFPEVQVVRCPGNKSFHRSKAKNAGAFAATTPWICLIDADIILKDSFSTEVLPLLRNGYSYRASVLGEGTGGTIICRKDDFESVGGHDTHFEGWGEEDDDLRDALKFSGITEDCYPESLIDHLDHDDQLRMQFHESSSRRKNHMINRMYRVAKWDIARLLKRRLSEQECKSLYSTATEKVKKAFDSGTGVLEFELGEMTWSPVQLSCQRRLCYDLQHFVGMD